MLWTAWVLYVAAFLWNHARVRLARRGRAPVRRIQRDRRSDIGMLAQFAAVTLTFAVRRPEPASAWLAIAGAAALYGGVLVTWVSLGYLGRQWRMAAVVTDDQELVTGGPYRLVRHPVYTAFFAMLAGSILLASQWWAGVVAVILHVAGTEVRIGAEDRLLARHFGAAFERYKSATPAWLPPIR